MIWLVFLGGLVAVAGFAVYAYLAKQKRIEAFGRMALQYGLTYASEDPFGTIAEPFHLFQMGDGRGIENVLYGAWQGIDVRAFDYWYYDESTDSKGHTSRSYSRFDCALLAVEAACSPITIDPENVLTRLADHLAMHDIQFESEAFNDAFNVKSPDRKFANDLIDARMQQWLLMLGRGYSFEVVGDRMLCFCRQIDPTGFIALLGTAKVFLENVPHLVASLYPKNSG